MIPLRYTLALIIFTLIMISAPAIHKIQLSAILLCLPQIFRKSFQRLFGLNARTIRIELGPVSAILLLFSFIWSKATTTHIIFLALFLSIGIIHIPDKNCQTYKQDKKIHGIAMRTIFSSTIWLMLFQFIKNQSASQIMTPI